MKSVSLHQPHFTETPANGGEGGGKEGGCWDVRHIFYFSPGLSTFPLYPIGVRALPADFLLLSFQILQDMTNGFQFPVLSLPPAFSPNCLSDLHRRYIYPAFLTLAC